MSAARSNTTIIVREIAFMNFKYVLILSYIIFIQGGQEAMYINMMSEINK